MRQVCGYLYVRVQRLAQVRPLGVHLDQAVDVTALGRLLQAEPQSCSRAVALPHEVNILVLRQDEAFALRPVPKHPSGSQGGAAARCRFVLASYMRLC